MEYRRREDEKSVGNIVDPFVLADKYGSDSLRYYLMSDIATGSDADFSEERLVERYNGDLANSLGNLLNRTLNMAHRYRGGRVKSFDGMPLDLLPEGNEEVFDLLSRCRIGLGRYRGDFMDLYAVSDGLKVPFSFVRGANFLIDYWQPWKLAKESSEEQRLSLLLFVLIETLRVVAILISPVLSRAAHGIFDQLNWKMDLRGKEQRFSLADAEWGKLPDGHVVGKPVPLFPRIEA